jgi:hypothetical protein
MRFLLSKKRVVSVSYYIHISPFFFFFFDKNNKMTLYNPYDP